MKIYEFPGGAPARKYNKSCLSLKKKILSDVSQCVQQNDGGHPKNNVETNVNKAESDQTKIKSQYQQFGNHYILA